MSVEISKTTQLVWFPMLEKVDTRMVLGYFTAPLLLPDARVAAARNKKVTVKLLYCNIKSMLLRIVFVLVI